MNYNEIDVDKIVNEVSVAVAQGNYRKATKKESMEVRLVSRKIQTTKCYIGDFIIKKA
jgi:hypothetical protein